MISHQHRKDTRWPTCGRWGLLWPVSAHLSSFTVLPSEGQWDIGRCSLMFYYSCRDPLWSSLCSFQFHLPSLLTLLMQVSEQMDLYKPIFSLAPNLFIYKNKCLYWNVPFTWLFSLLNRKLLNSRFVSYFSLYLSTRNNAWYAVSFLAIKAFMEYQLGHI